MWGKTASSLIGPYPFWGPSCTSSDSWARSIAVDPQRHPEIRTKRHGLPRSSYVTSVAVLCTGSPIPKTRQTRPLSPHSPLQGLAYARRLCTLSQEVWHSRCSQILMLPTSMFASSLTTTSTHNPSRVPTPRLQSHFRELQSHPK